MVGRRDGLGTDKEMEVPPLPYAKSSLLECTHPRHYFATRRHCHCHREIGASYAHKGPSMGKLQEYAYMHCISAW